MVFSDLKKIKFMPAGSVFWGILFLLTACSSSGVNHASGALREGEKIVYRITPAGKAVFRDRGMVVLGGKDVRLIECKTEILGFRDTEKIYSDSETMLPLRVEREISFWIREEKIVEEYDQKNHILTVTKYRGDRKISQQKIEKDGPIHNAVILLLLLRGEESFPPGWKMPVRLLEDFTLEYKGIETITVQGKKFNAYHFRSSNRTFETWISDDERRIPLRIRGLGPLRYSLEMEEYTLK